MDMDRRQLLGTAAAAFAGTSLAGTPLAAAAGTRRAPATPAHARARLRAGNARWVAGRALHPDLSRERLTETAKEQAPYAAILGCSDSRLAPELLFDEGIGDLFCVRVAGNLVDPAGLGTLEYGVLHFPIRLILVLGHERCGAVEAAVQAARSGETPPGSLPALTGPIAPAVQDALRTPGRDVVERAVLANVRRQRRLVLERSGIVSAAARAGKLAVAAARYDLDSGRVRFL